MIAIMKKELRSYLTSMIGYIFLGFLVFLTALYFRAINIYNANTNYQTVLSGMAIFFLFLIPALTMRSFSEEAKQKTDQLLFTSPLTVAQIVIGKYLAALVLFLFGMLLTTVFPMILSRYGEVQTAHVVSAYIGYILLGACFISVGIFVSVLTDNQIISAVVTFGSLFIFFIIDNIAVGMPKDRPSSIAFVLCVIVFFCYIIYDSTKNLYAALLSLILGFSVVFIAYGFNHYLYDGLIGKILSWMSILSRFQNFNSGIISFSDIVYYFTFSIAFIYLTINTIEKRRWK